MNNFIKFISVKVDVNYGSNSLWEK